MKLQIFAFLVLLGIVGSAHAQSQSLSIVNVRRNIPLANDEPAYRDYYLNGGSDIGLKRGQVLNVVRKMMARDASGTQSYGDMYVPIGELKIIAVFENSAVARESKVYSREELPVVDQIGLMTGDQVDLKNQYSPSGKK